MIRNVNPPGVTPEQRCSLEIEDILSMETFVRPGSIAVSPNGRQLAITVQSHSRRRYGGSIFLPTGIPPWLEGSEIWIVEVESGNCHNLTPNWGTSFRPSWSPDGSSLAFYSDKNGTAQLWIWECGTEQLYPACDSVIQSYPPALKVPPRWTPDSKQIVFTLPPKTRSGEKDESKAASLEASVRIFRSIPKIADEGKTDFMPQSSSRFLANIGVVTIATGEVKKLEPQFYPLGFLISPDGTTAAVMSFQGLESVESGQFLFNLYLLPLSGEPPRCLAECIQLKYDSEFSWSPDGRYIAYTTDGPKALGELFIVSVTSGSVRNLTAEKGVQLRSKCGSRSAPLLWSEDSRNLFCVSGANLWQISMTEDGAIRKVTDGLSVIRIIRSSEAQTVWSPDNGQSIIVQTYQVQSKQEGFARIDLKNGEATQLIEENYLYDIDLNIDVAPDTKRIFYIAEDRTHPADVWKADASFQSRRQLTRLNPKIERVNFGEAQIVSWKTFDGRDLQGVLLLPASYVSGERYPLITKVYGGSFLSDQLNYFGVSGSSYDNMYLLTTSGYAVFLPDLPIKTHSPIQELTEIVLSGVDRVIDLGIVDAERLGIMGHSYGGYCVNGIITQTSRFRAAVSSASICNLVSFYGFLTEEGDSGISWVETGQGRMGGSLWEQRERYIENSPVFHLDKVETPLLLIYGELDSSAAGQAGEMFSGLRRLDKKVVLACYLGEDHSPGSWRYPNAVDFWQRVLAWFDEHLKF
ncbi:S9 family peptidase [Candidatus Poribacteria bacterium]|nr:S9 family peptidase [Candidatus Poribacteria bacterium]